MDHCLIADPLPAEALGRPIRTDYRAFVRFEAAMLRAKDDRAAGPLIQKALRDTGLPAGSQTERSFEALLWFYRGGRAEPEAPRSGVRPELASDYIIDGPLIAAAFQAAYGLDLTSPDTQLHWWRFQALLQGLPDECRFCRVVGWRTADLTGMKGKKLAFYQSMKTKFALPADLGGEKRVYASKADWDAAFIARLKRSAARK